MPIHRRFFALTTTGVAALLTLSLTACGAAPHRPAPTKVVSKYLTAISEGDATTAARLDSEAVNNTYRTSTSDQDESDLGSLRTDSVLQSADERIEKVQVKTNPKSVQGEDDTLEIGFTYELNGKEHSSALTVHWSPESSEWVLEDSLTVQLFVDAQKSTVQTQSAPFRIVGIQDSLRPSEEGLPYMYLVYPGVYRVTADIPKGLLAPNTETSQTVTADTSGDARATFEVLELPTY